MEQKIVGRKPGIRSIRGKSGFRDKKKMRQTLQAVG